ncbi:MAG: GNAT family N-acetyltransferase [Okeania sp. SIO2H7]|nr:GNAT family N-acetyltransferase [Okeania sp. SIO2H7]
MKVEIISRLTEAQIEDLQQLYQTTWWARDRTIPGIRKMLQNTDLIVGLCEVESQKLIAFSRILTDYVYRALILDVVVAESLRGQGLGRVLMEAIANHSSLQEVELILLTCLPEMVSFYEKLGFTEDGLTNIRLMKFVNS